MTDPKKHIRYAVLHVPTASYLCSRTRSGGDVKLSDYKVTIFRNKPAAGHAIADYISHNYNRRPYYGAGLLLESDLRLISSEEELWQLSLIIRGRVPYNKIEFEYIPEDMLYGNTNKTSLESSTGELKE